MNSNKSLSTATPEQWPTMLTVREVSQILRIDPQTAKRWIIAKKLPAVRINKRGDYQVQKAEVMKLLEIT